MYGVSATHVFSYTYSTSINLQRAWFATLHTANTHGSPPVSPRVFSVLARRKSSPGQRRPAPISSRASSSWARGMKIGFRIVSFVFKNRFENRKSEIENRITPVSGKETAQQLNVLRTDRDSVFCRTACVLGKHAPCSRRCGTTHKTYYFL